MKNIEMTNYSLNKNYSIGHLSVGITYRKYSRMVDKYSMNICKKNNYMMIHFISEEMEEIAWCNIKNVNNIPK